MLARAAAVDNFGAGRTLARMALATRSDDHSHPDLATKAEVDDKFSEVAALRADFAEHRMEQTGEVATLRADFAELRADFTELRGDFTALRGEFAEHRAEQREAIAELRADFTVLSGKITAIEGGMAEYREETARLREEVARLREEVARHGEGVAELRGSMKLLMWGIGIGFAAMFAGFGIVVAVLAP